MEITPNEMKLEYKLSSMQLRKYLFLPLIKLSAVVVGATIVGAIWFSVKRDAVLLVTGWTWAWIFFMHFLPLLIIAIRHNHLSQDTYFTINTTNNTFEYKHKGISISFHLTEIDKVVKVVSPPTYDDRIDLLGFGYFYYWKIVLVDGRTLSMSCMLLDVDHFPGKEFSKEKKLFPIPPSNHHTAPNHNFT